MRLCHPDLQRKTFFWCSRKEIKHIIEIETISPVVRWSQSLSLKDLFSRITAHSSHPECGQEVRGVTAAQWETGERHYQVLFRLVSVRTNLILFFHLCVEGITYRFNHLCPQNVPHIRLTIQTVRISGYLSPVFPQESSHIHWGQPPPEFTLNIMHRKSPTPSINTAPLHGRFCFINVLMLLQISRSTAWELF